MANHKNGDKQEEGLIQEKEDKIGENFLGIVTNPHSACEEDQGVCINLIKAKKIS